MFVYWQSCDKLRIEKWIADLQNKNVILARYAPYQMT